MLSMGVTPEGAEEKDLEEEASSEEFELCSLTDWGTVLLVDACTGRTSVEEASVAEVSKSIAAEGILNRGEDRMTNAWHPHMRRQILVHQHRRRSPHPPLATKTRNNRQLERIHLLRYIP